MGIYLTDEEMDTLYGLPSLAKCLYLVLRKSMDGETKVSGRIKRHSYQSLAENLEEHRAKGTGFQIIKPTLQQIRTAIANLVKSGLVVDLGNLCFELCQASTFSRQKQTQQVSNSFGNEENAIKLSACATTQHDNHGEQRIHQRFKMYKSNACADPLPQHAPVIEEARAVLAWVEENGVKITKKSKPEDAIRLFKAGKSTVQAAANIAHGVRQREGSNAPINLGLLLKCLPKGAFCPKPKATTPSEPRQRPATSQPRFTAEDQAKGLAFLQRVAKRKEARHAQAM